jgi:hypothetical protein
MLFLTYSEAPHFSFPFKGKAGMAMVSKQRYFNVKTIPTQPSP